MYKILYVEDNEDNSSMLRLRLTKRGYEVITAINGLEGINKAREEKPDLILMDIGLPVLDGYQATKVIKTDPVIHNTPIIILTAHAMVTEIEKAKQFGADDFDTKPIDIKRLMQKIEKFLVPNLNGIDNKNP